MSLLNFIPGVSGLVKTVGNVVVKGREAWKGNVEKREVRDAANKASARSQFANEFIKPENWFDSLINGMNRLPRPMLALGTIGLFVYAFIDPTGFAVTMKSLDLVPAELWWLLSAIVTFYFGVREFSGNRKHKQVMAHLSNQPKMDKTANEGGWDTNVPNPPLSKLQTFRKNRGEK